MIHQLIYASAATTPFSDEALEALLEKSRHNNAALRVTGLLVYDEGSFLQVLEGEKHVVERLYRRIAADPRHERTVVLSRGPIDQRGFEGWAMGFARPRDSERPPGFSDFLRTGVYAHTEDREDRARRILYAFREGRWRRGPTEPEPETTTAT